MKNVAASVRDRLMNQARAGGVPFAALLERFVIGRLLWRLSCDERGRQFVLKGAQLFSLWAQAQHRPTRDLDLLGIGESSPEALQEFFKGLVATPAKPEDGLLWGKVRAEPIRKEQRYEVCGSLSMSPLRGQLFLPKWMWVSGMPLLRLRWKWCGMICWGSQRRDY